MSNRIVLHSCVEAPWWVWEGVGGKGWGQSQQADGPQKALAVLPISCP